VAILTGGKVIEGVYRPYLNAGVPSAGTNGVQTLTIGGTPSGGTFKLSFDGSITAAITWSATNVTLLANINTALDAAPSVGVAGLVATAGTLTAGIGTITLTAGAALARLAINTVAAADNSLTGTAPTLAVAETTPGVTATNRGAPPGGLLIDVTNAKLYVNSGTALAPTYIVAGTQT